MIIDLNAPLCAIDVETTGPHPRVDRIVQLGVVKVMPGEREWRKWKAYINPECAIPPEVTAIHGITDEIVRGALTFKELAPKLASAFHGCDFLGYNVEFDLNFLIQEFARVAGDTKARQIINGRVIDPMHIYRKYHGRTLTDAVKQYLGEELEGAHDAGVDSEAALRVWEAQMEEHPDLPRTVEELHRMFFETVDDGKVDPEGKLYWKHGEATLNFSEHAGKSLRSLREVDSGFLQWVLKKDFSDGFKKICRDALDGKFPERKK